ncbi:MAG: InlB B-repeat-containing protein, partial [Paludibacteraceae bacterium]|nr:InlB B-repeat-containing protein [Paludibacteraceae bacterium]
MKNLNLIERLWTDSHEKQSPQRFARYAAILIMLLALGVGQMWAADMYIKGERNSWSSEKMTEEVSGSRWTFTAFWLGGTSYDAFKITSKTDWSGLNLGGSGSNVNLSWGTKSGALLNDGGSKDIILPSFATQGGIIKITVTYESSKYYVKAEKLAEEQTTWRQISAPKIYWNNTDANYTNVTMINGRYTNYGGDGKGTVASPLTHITNTNLWYNTSINNGTGDGSWFTSTLFVDANWDGWESGNVPTERAMYATSNTAVNTAALYSNTFLFSGANANRGATLNRSQLSSGYSELNKTQTVEVYVKVGSGSYTKRTSSWPGTLTPDRYYLSNATTATHVNNTALTAGSSVTVSAVLTSAFSLSESSTADGYNFDGWGTSSSSTPSGKNAAYSISSITGANTICAFFTAPSYSITYNLNGGTQQVSPAPATSYTVESSAITLPTPTRDGYDFDGWFDNSSFTGSAITTIAAGSTGNKEYWAKWTVASTYYDVTFGVAASGHGTLAAVKTVNSASITSGDDLLSGTAITFTATPSSYYEVEGWYTNSACTLGKHDAGETTYSVASLGSDITIYVKFKPITYNITYNLNSGTNNPGNPATYTYESSAITLQDPTRDGYTFGGWYTEVGLTNRVYSIAAGSNGNKAFWAKWTEKMTTVTVNVSPSGAGTLTVGGAAFTPGNTTTAGVTTSRTVVATPASGKVFLDWSVSGNATGTNSTNTYTLKGNGSAGTGTLTANFGVASGWYMEGTAFGGWVRPNTATYQFARPYRGMENVFYYPASLAASSYWKVNDGTKPYSISNSTTAITKKTIYSLTEEWSNSTYASSAMTNIWVVLDKSNKKLWVQDPQTYYNVNVSGANDSKGPVKVTLKTTSAITLSGNVLETTQFANGETFTVTVTGVSGWIPTITIGGVTTTFWKEAASYSADGTMSTSDVAVTISYTASRAVTFATTTGGSTITATGPSSTSVTSGTKIKDGTEIRFAQTNATGYTFSKWYSTSTGSDGKQYSTSSPYDLTVSSTDNAIYPIYTENMTTVTLVASPTGKGTFTSGGGAVTSVSAGVTTHPTVTAVPASGYRVNTSATVWSESSDYITISATNAASTTITGSGTSGNSATLTATFTPIVYTITLNDNEGSGGVGSATVTFDNDNFAFASSFVAPTRTGYIFQGYYTASSMDVGDQLIDEDGNWQSDTEPYTYINEDGKWIYPNNMSLYAGWTPITFTIHYDANGGSGSMDDQVAKYEVESSLDGQNSYIDVNRFTAPTGYGIYYPAHPWNTSADGTGTDIDAATYQSTLTSTNGATVNLYAQWSGRFVLKANYDGGVDGYFRVHYNTAIIEALTTLYPTRLGYLCDGYYTADEDGTKVLNGDGTVVDGNVSGYVTGGKWTYKGTQDFYAHWNQIKYNLAFDGNDCAAYVGEATGSKASMANVEYETDVDITAGTLAREGYTFAGWSKTACATSPTYVGSTTRHISSTDGDNVTLYAVWNAKNYTISFNALGGDCYTTSKSVAMGANYGSLPTAYGNSGYEFVGWYTRPEGGTLVTEETQMVTASDHTLYAHYEKKERVYFKNTLGWESVYVTWD